MRSAVCESSHQGCHITLITVVSSHHCFHITSFITHHITHHSSHHSSHSLITHHIIHHCVHITSLITHHSSHHITHHSSHHITSHHSSHHITSLITSHENITLKAAHHPPSALGKNSCRLGHSNVSFKSWMHSGQWNTSFFPCRQIFPLYSTHTLWYQR